MARCEDFPCCGHELGCCPDFDEAGNQLNMKCVCGATVPLSSKSSLCPRCLSEGEEEEHDYDPYFPEERDAETPDEYDPVGRYEDLDGPEFFDP